jgi:hypothetical protein
MHKYYEEAAHIARVLTECGMPLNWVFPVHHLLLAVAYELETWVRNNPSHASAGARLVDILSAGQVDDSRRPRLNAIAGTLIGDFLLVRATRRS